MIYLLIRVAIIVLIMVLLFILFKVKKIKKYNKIFVIFFVILAITFDLYLPKDVSLLRFSSVESAYKYRYINKNILLKIGTENSSIVFALDNERCVTIRAFKKENTQWRILIPFVDYNESFSNDESLLIGIIKGNNFDEKYVYIVQNGLSESYNDTISPNDDCNFKQVEYCDKQGDKSRFTCFLIKDNVSSFSFLVNGEKVSISL